MSGSVAPTPVRLSGTARTTHSPDIRLLFEGSADGYGAIARALVAIEQWARTSEGPATRRRHYRAGRRLLLTGDVPLDQVQPLWRLGQMAIALNMRVAVAARPDRHSETGAATLATLARAGILRGLVLDLREPTAAPDASGSEAWIRLANELHLAVEIWGDLRRVLGSNLLDDEWLSRCGFTWFPTGASTTRERAELCLTLSGDVFGTEEGWANGEPPLGNVDRPREELTMLLNHLTEK